MSNPPSRAPEGGVALIDQVREAIKYAPKTGPVSSELAGVMVDASLVCASCVGRIYGRGMGHLIRTCLQVWKDEGANAYCGVCNADVVHVAR